MAAPTSAPLHPPIVGVCPVLETPFDDRGEPDYPGFEMMVEHMRASGVTALMYPGFASEFYKLADVERDRLVETLLDRTRAEAITTVISVTAHATCLAVDQARRAADLGADAISVLPPYFLAPSAAAVRGHLRVVLDAVAPLPVILQYSPAQTGTALDVASIAGLAREHPNLRQVKVESTPPGPFIAALGQEQPRLPALVGYAGLQLPDAVRRGAVGVQPGCSFVELYLRFWEHWSAGRHAEAVSMHTRMVPYLSYWMQSVELIIAAEKLISYRRGWISSPHCRAPGYPLDTEEIRQIDRFLHEFAEELHLDRSAMR